MTIQEFAQQIIDDPQYRQTLLDRARAGTLSEDVEILLLELASGWPATVAADRAGPPPPPVQNARTLALIRRPLAIPTDEKVPS